ncbi:immunoglobulin-like domain-containing protein, partial [Brochothrix thermosphacta]|uniref:immunoglobulin-like domain-containing protein n=1 Tax=Brochothrix thermosphacta TaxID=2756 RepID=UPI00159F22D2
PKEYVIGTATISGTHGKDIKGVRLFVNGEVKKNATLAEGKYQLVFSFQRRRRCSYRWNRWSV